MKEQEPINVVKHYTDKLKSKEQTLIDMYAQAVAAGYQGSYEQWRKVMGQ